MKRIILPIVLMLIEILSNNAYGQNSESIHSILQLVSQNLKHLGKVSYNYSRETNYASEDYHNKFSGTSYIDFSQLNPTFQLETAAYKTIYNGNESFLMDKKDRTMEIAFKPNYNSFVNLSFFVNSLFTLRNGLSLFIADSSVEKRITDTLISGKSYLEVTCTLHNKTLNGFGNETTPTTLKRDFLYHIIIDKTTYLPIAVIQKNDAEPKDFMTTTFSNIKNNVAAPGELSWYFSTYANDFKIISKKKLELIKPNVSAPDWSLPFYDSSDSLQLKNLKGKVILLDFWMKNCGPCIASVPKLNELMKKYQNKLNLIGINRYDSKKDIDVFYKKHNPDYRTLYDVTGIVTKAYGVDGFPQLVLIDTHGIVRYAGNSDIGVVEKILDNNLQ
ncbi:TlpA family protein disulfide reductase [Rhizosphaericola mali]|uniref:TlpA family protein disulfide reductase n=1 Tax=Rhizosphaericola mali TaxID=2545455 RepID=A0A5P2GBE1_9BACT|nr:TlpA disulfide reductase family protein [Rhizosphaericola mali]QES90533.1 TlpA family protein disulfide reductase [Rhizosphaericola mali]